ncbi:MAG: hypothetical protein HOP11_15735 [Saprospiraceae bacterium]|nr:hypothetical protein [Saprospiraceae bacterium]
MNIRPYLKLNISNKLLQFLLLNIVLASGAQIGHSQSTCNCPSGATQIGTSGTNTLYTSTNLPNTITGETLCISGTLVINTTVDLYDCIIWMNTESEILIDGQTFGTIK